MTSNGGVRRVGDWYVLRHMVYGPSGIGVNGCSDVLIEDVQLFSIPGMGFPMGQSKNLHLKNCGVRFRGGTGGRPMSTTADASHFNECSGTVRLEGVHFEGQGDDGLNVHGMFHDVRKLYSTAETRKSLWYFSYVYETYGCIHLCFLFVVCSGLACGSRRRKCRCEGAVLSTCSSPMRA